jgi:hypothetical protein
VSASTEGARKVRLHRFRDTIAMAVADKDGYHTTVYIPLLMLHGLAEQLIQGKRDICHRNFPQSTFKPRTIDSDGNVEFE